jgi:hypothetical protein
MRSAILLAAVCALALCGCNKNQTQGVAVGTAACKAFPTAAAPVGSDPGAVLDDCLHRWSYALAKSTDGADLVAQAAVAACSAPLSRWNQQAVGAGAPPEAPSLLTGETTNPIAAHTEFARGRALFYVVQGRAGKCPGPRVEGRDTASAANPDR